MNITFFIDAPSKYICDWLEDFTGDAPYKSFKTEKGRLVIQRARPSSSGNSISIAMEGMYIIPKGSNSETGYQIGNAIKFKIIPLTPSRIEVAAKCNQPVLRDYFLDILTEMNKRWPQSEDVRAELTKIRKVFETGLAEIKLGQSALYSKIGELERTSVNQILEAVQKGRIEQGEIERTLDAIRRALKYIQTAGIAIDDTEMKKALDNIYQSVTSNLDMRQQLELSLPIIPFLLQYKLCIEASVDLEAVWKDLLQRIRKCEDNA